MTKITDDLKAKVLAERSSMTTSGLSKKYGLSASSIRRIYKTADAEDTKKQEPVRMPKLTIEMKDKIPEVSFSEPLTLDPFTKSKNTIVENDGEDGEVQIETIDADDREETNEFVQHFADDEEDEEEPDEDDDGYEQPPDIGGRPSDRNAYLNKLAGDMEKADEEASRAVERLLGEDIGEQVPQVIKQSRNKPTPEEVKARIEAEAEERSRYLSRIYLNVINFSEHLTFIKNQDKFLTSLHRKTTKELIALSQLIETQRSLANVGNQMKHMFFMGVRGAEVVGQKYLRMKTHGFTEEMLKKERELEMIFQEIAIEQAENLRAYTTPTMRLGMLFASTFIMVDNKNRMNEMREQIETKPANPDLSNSYSDI